MTVTHSAKAGQDVSWNVRDDPHAKNLHSVSRPLIHSSIRLVRVAMIRFITFLIVLATLVIPLSGFAADLFFTGNKLYSECTSSDNSDQMHCLGYLNGITDVLSGSDRISVFRACLPDITTGQAMDIVVKSLRSRPEDRHQPAALLVASALAAAFPCRQP